MTGPQILRLSDASRRTLTSHPAFAARVRVLEIPRPTPPDDETTTAQTIAVMRQLVKEDSSAPTVRAATSAAARAAATPTPLGVAAAIHAWIRQHVSFAEDATVATFAADPQEAEVLIRPRDLLAMPRPAGDCDDYTMLAAAMLRAAGIAAAFVTVAADDRSPDYSHVYAAAYPAGRYVAMDASHGPRLGWETRAEGKRRVWRIDDEPTTMQRANLGFDWNGFENVLQTGIKSTAQILGPRYAVPQLNPGQYIQQGNSIMYQQPAGGGAAFGLPAGAGSNSMMLMMAGLGLLVVLLVANKKQ